MGHILIGKGMDLNILVVIMPGLIITQTSNENYVPFVYSLRLQEPPV
jgi:hypothetical protein